MSQLSTALIAFEGSWKAKLIPLLKKTFDQAGVDTIAQLHGVKAAAGPKVKPTSFAFDTNNSDAASWATDHAGELISGVTQATRDSIHDLVADAFNSDDGYDASALVDDIAAEIGGDEARAELIAQTETMAAANAGQQEAWAQAVDSGLLNGDEQQEWIVSDDDAACDDCSDLDGETVGLDEEFSDGSDGPPAHPNCRCTLGLVAPKNAAGRQAWFELRDAWPDASGYDDHGREAAIAHLEGGGKSATLTAENGAQAAVVRQGKSFVVHTQTAGGMRMSGLKPYASAKHALGDAHAFVKFAGQSKRVTLRTAWLDKGTGEDDHGRDPNKVAAARASHVPQTKAKIAAATAMEHKVVAAIPGAEHVGGNQPMDVVIRDSKGNITHALEVKTIYGKNDKITMHPKSRKLKEKFARKNKASSHTIAIDARGKTPAYYHREGFGSYRLKGMTRVKLSQLQHHVRPR